MTAEFITWQGGKMPVALGEKITVKRRDGDEFECRAGDMYSNDWSVNEKHPVLSDIIAYKVGWQEARPPEQPSPPDNPAALIIIPVDNGYLITRKGDGTAYVQRREPEALTDPPLSFQEELIVVFCDIIAARYTSK